MTLKTASSGFSVGTPLGCGQPVGHSLTGLGARVQVEATAVEVDRPIRSAAMLTSTRVTRQGSRISNSIVNIAASSIASSPFGA